VSWYLPHRYNQASQAQTAQATPFLGVLCSGEEDDDISEDLDAAMRSLQALTSKVSGDGMHAWLVSCTLWSVLACLKGSQ
jgi:hypothetical protein